MERMIGLSDFESLLLFAVLIALISVCMGIGDRRKRRETIDGYEQAELVEVIFQKTKAYRAAEPWPEMAGVSSVLDFGGGCGIHYRQANSPDIRWAVVETPAMVARAKELETDRLRFFSDIKQAVDWLGTVDVVHSNGALQYVDDPAEKLKQLCSVGAKAMLWYRTALSDGETERELQSSRLGDNGPGRINVKEKTVRYERTKIPERKFLATHEGYRLAERGGDWFKFYGTS
jgi:putative methyltransferase (TIGR04325 family)